MRSITFPASWQRKVEKVYGLSSLAWKLKIPEKHIIFSYYLFSKVAQFHEIMFFIFWWPIALHHSLRGVA